MLYLFSLFALSKIGLRPYGLILLEKTKGIIFTNKNKFRNNIIFILKEFYNTNNQLKTYIQSNFYEKIK